MNKPKVSAVPSGVIERTTTYTYDVHTDDELDGGQHNNRLLSYEITAPGDPIPVFIERGYYQYGADGNVSRIIKIVPGIEDPLIWWLYYNNADQLWLAVTGAALFDEETGAISDPVYWDAAEYRYGSGRQRYLFRKRNPNINPATGKRWDILGNDAWREFLGEDIHRDYTVEIDPQTSEVTLTPRTQYAAGLGYQDEGAASPSYTATDHLGTVRRITDATSAVSQRTIYTAFGERTDTSALNTNRYGYAGAHGYEEPIPNLDPLEALGWLHVGERYNDPGSGRFVQRDPIGIVGGFNVYEYVANAPILAVDPKGMCTWAETTELWDPWNGDAANPVHWPEDLRIAVIEAHVDILAIILCGRALPKAGALGGSGLIRWGPGYICKGATQKVFRIAFGGRKRFIHGHIHRGNWYKPWRWFQKLGPWKRYD